MNRGIAHRRVFESEDDIRFFLSLLAEEVRRGTIEIHAYCILSTHFHLLIRSPKGELSAAMRRVKSRYVQCFNRRGGRDGALFRGRFHSVLVEDEVYLRVLFRYIDRNAVEAGIVADPADFPFCTAFHWARNSFPSWLERSWVEQELRENTGFGAFARPTSYRDLFGRPLTDDQREWVERWGRGVPAANPIEQLFDAAPRHVRQWLKGCARVADGTKSRRIVPPDCVIENVKRLHPVLSPVVLQGTVIRPELMVEAALLRDLAALSYREIAARTGTTIATARNRCVIHRRMIASNRAYIEAVAAVVSEVLRQFGRGVDDELSQRGQTPL